MKNKQLNMHFLRGILQVGTKIIVLYFFTILLILVLVWFRQIWVFWSFYNVIEKFLVTPVFHAYFSIFGVQYAGLGEKIVDTSLREISLVGVYSILFLNVIIFPLLILYSITPGYKPFDNSYYIFGLFFWAGIHILFLFTSFTWLIFTHFCYFLTILYSFYIKKYIDPDIRNSDLLKYMVSFLFRLVLVKVWFPFDPYLINLWLTILIFLLPYWFPNHINIKYIEKLRLFARILILIYRAWEFRDITEEEIINVVNEQYQKIKKRIRYLLRLPPT